MKGTLSRKLASKPSARLPGDALFFWSSRSARRKASATSGPSAPATCTGGRFSIMKKRIPTFKSDNEAEAFVDTADLTEYDLSGAKPVRFEFRQISGIDEGLRLLV